MASVETEAKQYSIFTKDLRVDYGSLTAVKDMNLKIEKGEIFGLIGPNGAGKSSTIRVLAALQEPTYGDVYVEGIDVLEDPHEVHRKMGYMPDLPIIDKNLKVWEYLDLFASLHLLPESKRKARIDECLVLTDLTAKKNVFTDQLSRGLRQRLMLAKTLLHDPEILILDEPAGGLDPMARIELRKLLKGLSKQGKTILISSHILTELSDFCSSIGVMEKGILLEHGSIKSITNKMQKESRRYIVECLKQKNKISTFLKAQKYVEDIKEGEEQRLILQFTGNEEQACELLASLVHEKHLIKGFYEQKMDVEEIFLEIGAKEVS